MHRFKFICGSCRFAAKLQYKAAAGKARCPNCAGLLLFAGDQIHIPRKSDTRGWNALSKRITDWNVLRQARKVSP